jgi:predicted Holliday junction resolvase-like endonuclease
MPNDVYKKVCNFSDAAGFCLHMTTTIRKMKGAHILLSVTAITTLLAASINAMPPVRHPRVRQVNRRFERQQDRISDGVKSGQLTSRETANLETKEAALKSEEHTFRLENGGSLTRGEQVTLNKQENKLSSQIYNQKHDAQTSTTTPKSEVGSRLENQQDRIAAGIKSGELTSGETARLEARETALRTQISTDRNANGGKLTDTERTQVNQELNNLSTRIYKQKHDDQTQPH